VKVADRQACTINKHLEPIFAKLNVENLTSAAMMAARALWGD